MGNRVVSRLLTPGRGRGAVRRFGSEEHRQLGEAAAPGVASDINIGTAVLPRFLTFGEMVMMGDYFASIDEMRTLAGTQAGRDEIAWARWWALEGSPARGPEPPVAQAVRDRVRDRYFGLAAANITHFSAGGTARPTYEGFHERALREAWDAGRRGATGADALALARTTEAFAAHFLTDMFSTGHVRTPRTDIRSWYSTHMPRSIDQFVRYMARHMHAFAVREHPVAHFFGAVPSQADLETTIRTIGGTALAAFTLGDIVSLGYHNLDSRGLAVVSDTDVAGTTYAGGYQWRGVGDALLATSATTRDMATAALRLSLAELDQLYAAGASSRGAAHPDRVAEMQTSALQRVRPFAALRLVPREDPTAANVALTWQWGSFNQAMRDAVDDAVRHDVADQLAAIAATQTDANRRAALMDFVRHLRTDGIAALERAVAAPAGPTATTAPVAPSPATTAPATQGATPQPMPAR